MPHILLAEDDPLIACGLKEFLCGEGFTVDRAATQAAAMCALSGRAYDLLLLDIALPDGSGFGICAAAKAAQSDVPVIFLTAADEEYSVVAGLDMGADDYISKPFRPRELLSRIRSVLRRAGRLQSVLECGPVSIDVSRGTAMKNGEELCLSALEYRLLLLLLTNRGVVLTRERLLSELWDAAGEFVNDNTLTVYIKRLRDKIEDDPQNPAIIRTVRGVGYRVCAGGGRI